MNLKISPNIAAKLLALALLSLLFIAPAVALAETMNDYVTDYGLTEFYAQTSWPTLHRDSRNSDFTPFVAPVLSEKKWTALDYAAVIAGVTIGPEGNLYVTTGKAGTDNLYALNRDGQILWSKALHSSAVGSSVIVDSDGDVYISAGGQLWAFHSDSSDKWVASIPTNFSTAIFTVEGYVGGVTSSGTVSLFNRDNGNLVGSLNLPAGVPVPPIPPPGVPIPPLPYPRGIWGNNNPADPNAISMMDPAISKGVFEFIFGRGATVLNTPAVNPVNNRIYITAAGPKVETSPFYSGLLYGLDVSPEGSLSIAFSAPMGPCSGTSPAISPDGLQVYAADGLGKLYAFDAFTGIKNWDLVIGENVASPSVGPDGTIYSLAGGKVVAIPESGGGLLWDINFDDYALTLLPQIGPQIPIPKPLPRVSRANSIISVTPNHFYGNLLYVTANLGYQLTTTYFIPARTFMFIIDPANGSVVAPPMELRDTTEGVLTMASDGSIYIPHGAIASSIAVWGVIPTLPQSLRDALRNAIKVQPIGGISALEPISFLDLVESGIHWVQDLDAAALAYLDSEEVDEAYTQVRRGVVQLGATFSSISDAEERGEIDSQTAQQARQRVQTAQTLLNNAKNHIAQARVKPNKGLLNSAKQLIENAEKELEQALSILEGPAAPPIAKTISKELRFSEGIPVRSELVQNYPNPFNPETWIPYNLAKEADVIVKIYNVSGQLIRTLDLNHQDAGFYLSKDKAAYWDGRDNLGEKVASGIYFYNLKAGDFRATRRMVIMK